MDLIKKANKLKYKHYTEFTIEELNKLPLENLNKQIEYYFIQKWLREKHNIHCFAWCNASGWAWEIEKTSGTHVSIMDIDGDIKGTEPESGMFKTYEQALEAGLFEALKLIK